MATSILVLEPFVLVKIELNPELLYLPSLTKGLVLFAAVACAIDWNVIVLAKTPIASPAPLASWYLRS